MFRDMAEVRQANADAGKHFFSSMMTHQYRSRVSGDLFGGRFFVTSEPDFWGNDRRYTVHTVKPDGSIWMVSNWRQFPTLKYAKYVARKLAKRDV